MPDYRFERECRTAQSEGYLISDGDQPVGRVDLHFTPSVVHGVLIVAERTTQPEVQELIALIDEDLVISADSSCEDFVVTVYQGHDLGTFSAQDLEEGEEEDEEVDESANW